MSDVIGWLAGVALIGAIVVICACAILGGTLYKTIIKRKD